MKTIRLLSTLLFLAAMSSADAVAATGRDGDQASFRAIMIVASKQKGETDRRLAPYEPTLRRILRFESYRFLSEDTGAIAVPGKGVLSLGSGHQLELETEQTGEGTRRVRIRWTAGNRVLMNTGLSLRPGVPAVLGGPPWGDKGDVSAMIVIVR